MNSAATADSPGLLKDRKFSHSRSSVVLSYAILVAGLLTACAALHMVIASYSSLPSTDGWEQIDTAMRGVNPLSPAWLWTQHNEHRMVVSKLFLATDLLLFRATQKFLLSSILATQFLLLWCWLEHASARRLARNRLAYRRRHCSLLPFLAHAVGEPGHRLFYLLHPAGIICHSLIRGAHALLEAFPATWRPASMGLSPVLGILAALGATYSLANGNLLWPLLVAAALLLRLPRVAVLSFLITGTVSTALYLHNYHRPLGHGNPASSIQSPLEIVQYIATYFGSPWVRHDVPLATLIGMPAWRPRCFVLFLAPAPTSALAIPFRFSFCWSWCFAWEPLSLLHWAD